MKTDVLGNSDLAITPIGFGAWAIGGDWEFGWGAQSVAAIHRALELGVNWIDTAAVYGLGHSEEVVARALQEWHGPRPYVFTKCGMIWNRQGKVDYSLRQESIRRECEASLRRLKTDVIDLYQIHWTADDLNETRFFNRLCILVALFCAGVGGGIDIEPGFLVKVDDRQRGMRIAEAFPDFVPGIDKIVLLLLWRGQMPCPEIFEQGIKPGPCGFEFPL